MAYILEFGFIKQIEYIYEYYPRSPNYFRKIDNYTANDIQKHYKKTCHIVFSKERE
jgi:hypothetical protein